MTFLEMNQQDYIQTIHLNRPDVHNAFHPELIAELTAAFVALKNKKDIRVVELAGRGKSFCAGADLRWMQDMVQYSLQQNLEDSDKLFEMFWQMATCPLPLVGRVQGSVFGGALGLVAVCDIVAAEKGTRFCFSEVKLGLAPAVISPFVAAKVAPSRIREWMLTGRIFEVDEAMAAGLVHFVGSREEVDDYVQRQHRQLMDAGPEAVVATKALLAEVLDMTRILQYRSLTARVIAERRVSDEGQEGLRSFFEKRPPQWRRPNKGAKP